MKKTKQSVSQIRHPRVKVVKKDKFGELQKLVLPLLVISLVYAIIAGSLTL